LQPPGKETVHRVVVPASIEAETRALLQAYGARGDMVTVVDFMAEGTTSTLDIASLK
jgi:cysteine synthase